MKYDIFLCYHRNDAAPHAWMLYRDLKDAGYSVFFGPECREPDSPEHTRSLIENCREVLLLLSHETFRESRGPNFLLQEICAALAQKKHIVGIPLPGFHGFPAALPEELQTLREIPILPDHDYPSILRSLLLGNQLLSTSQKSQDEIRMRLDSDPDLSSLLPELHGFARDLSTDRTILLHNRTQEWMEITLRRMTSSSLELLLDFQTAVVSAIPNVDETNLFQSLSREEFNHSLCQDLCIGAFHCGRLVGLLVLVPQPTSEQNLLLDLDEFRTTDPSEILVVDAVLVFQACRGFGLQKVFFLLAECISRQMGLRYECAVVSPLNFHSMRNTILSGFRLVGNFPKYRSTRNFFVRELR